MQKITDEPENRDIKESELTYFGRIAYKAAQEAKLEATRQTVEYLCAAFDLRLTAARHKYMESLDLPGLHALCEHLKDHRRWPK